MAQVTSNALEEGAAKEMWSASCSEKCDQTGAENPYCIDSEVCTSFCSGESLSQGLIKIKALVWSRT